jgi:hypothetical protein
MKCGTRFVVKSVLKNSWNLSPRNQIYPSER